MDQNNRDQKLDELLELYRRKDNNSSYESRVDELLDEIKKKNSVVSTNESNNYEEVKEVEELPEDKKTVDGKRIFQAVSCGTLALIIILTAYTCGRTHNKRTAGIPQTTITETTTEPNPSFDLEENIKSQANAIYNSIDTTKVTFTLEDVEETLRFLNGIKTNNEYTDIELLDMIDNVLYNGMDTYYGSLANTIGGVTPVDSTLKSMKLNNFFEKKSNEQVIVSKFDDIIDRIVKNQDNKEELNKLAEELLTLEVKLLESTVEVNGKNLSINDFTDGARAIIYSIMDQNDRVIKAIGGNNYSVTLEIVNDVAGLETETYSAEYIINKINKKDCVVYTPVGEEVIMDDHDNALINLLKLQESLHQENQQTLTLK